MYLTVITHASARDSEHNFRGLAPAGKEECAVVAGRYEAEFDGERTPAFDQIVSSPKPRCLETVILFAKGLGNDAIEASSVAVDAGLAAAEIEGGELAALATESDA
ncbi:MAG: histidine phosphatase family protein, partial [Candidatus Promineifilaceae bacterium]|nr:histidine phosphatase family protein [Candidatus Promineifilaceae bacterium]